MTNVYFTEVTIGLSKNRSNIFLKIENGGKQNERGNSKKNDGVIHVDRNLDFELNSVLGLRKDTLDSITMGFSSGILKLHLSRRRRNCMYLSLLWDGLRKEKRLNEKK